MKSCENTVALKQCMRITSIFCAALLFYPFSSKSIETDKKLSEANIIAKLKEYYALAQDYQADFVQTNAHKLFQGKLQRAYGRVKFKAGGLMRWEYQRPENKLFVYDGKTLWVYEPEVPQIFVGTADTDRLKKALAFLTGEGDILKEYKVKKLDSAKYGFKEGIVLGLWPKNTDSLFKKIEMYLDPTSFRAVRSVLVDLEGNRNRFDFYNPMLNNGLSKDVFSFTPPPGVPVTEAPTQQ